MLPLAVCLIMRILTAGGPTSPCSQTTLKQSPRMKKPRTVPGPFFSRLSVGACRYAVIDVLLAATGLLIFPIPPVIVPGQAALALHAPPVLSAAY